MDHQQQTNPDTTNELLTLLSDEYRRATIAYFRDSSESVSSLEDIADELCEEDQSEADRIAVQLHHSILPRLADSGVVNYDTKTNTAQYRGHSELEAMLDGIQHASQ
ncbi:hypothetical protein HUG10_12650 [Halorarum halophilum]|uniref:DUF7344 domain-containing protein n=1 Tax=Halorarum halophilum TaxID=2743090 RepID=A0A7D5L2V1_9EURY|nr:hypothetical protein [Halobaculum halophilum]QLG28343.1 hypothetical protein HUG10_12650 [Halobaculum halophilum]